MYVHHMGGNPQDLLLYFWNGKDFSRISNIGDSLRQQILMIAESHKAYPILHYYHANQSKNSLVICLCIIDEALDLLMTQVTQDQWDEKDVLPLRKAIDVYLQTMKNLYRYKGGTASAPPIIDLSKLSAAHVRLEKTKNQESERKALWDDLLKAKGWSWHEVYTLR